MTKTGTAARLPPPPSLVRLLFQRVVFRRIGGVRHPLLVQIPDFCLLSTARRQAGVLATSSPLLYEAPMKTGEKDRLRQERIPLGILHMVAATIVFAGSSALTKWLVATYPVG